MYRKTYNKNGGGRENISLRILLLEITDLYFVVTSRSTINSIFLISKSSKTGVIVGVKLCIIALSQIAQYITCSLSSE